MQFLTLGSILDLLKLIEKIYSSGKLQAVYEDVKRVLGSHGVETDNIELDRVIADAAVRQAQAAKEKTATE